MARSAGDAHGRCAQCNSRRKRADRKIKPGAMSVVDG